ncbi:MAG: ABC transporter ATP-binding protein [Phycisphaerales bacterium]
MSQTFIHDDEYSGALDLALWRRILGHMSPYRGRLAMLGGSGLLVAGVDVMFPMITGWMIDEAVASGVTSRLIGLGVIYAVLVVALASCVHIFIGAAGHIATGVACDLRRKGFSRLQELPFSYFDTRPVGWLVTRLTSDVGKVSNLIPWFMLDLVWGSCSLLGITAAMLWLDVRLALIVLTIVPPLIVTTIFFKRRLLASSRLVRRTNSQLTASFDECLMGVRTTKALAREEAALEEFEHVSTSMQAYSMRNALQSAVYLPMVISLGSVGVGLALWRGGVDVMAGTGLTLGALVAFMQYAGLFYMPIQELATRFTDLQAAQAAAERIQSLLDTEVEIGDSEDVRARLEAQTQSPKTDVAIDGGDETIREIEFRNVTFWYKPGEPVLESFDLRIEAGATVALVGATGGGKSTIVNLLARFYEPREGEILFNGVDYRDRSLHWLHSNLGVVLQTPHLFSGSIRDNIRYGRLDATNEEVEAAARLVNAERFITDLEHGYESEVGEGGSRLSTGQRQLISLARAVLADPQIFIMDEATSSVDTETERLIQNGIEAALAHRTAFVIAHRLSTICSADTILVIDQGRIVERGDHQSLLSMNGRYAALYRNQFAREMENAVRS